MTPDPRDFENARLREELARSETTRRNDAEAWAEKQTAWRKERSDAMQALWNIHREYRAILERQREAHHRKSEEWADLVRQRDEAQAHVARLRAALEATVRSPTLIRAMDGARLCSWCEGVEHASDCDEGRAVEKALAATPADALADVRALWRALSDLSVAEAVCDDDEPRLVTARQQASAALARCAWAKGGGGDGDRYANASWRATHPAQDVPLRRVQLPLGADGRTGDGAAAHDADVPRVWWR